MRGDGRVTGPTCVPVPATFDYRVVHSAINERTNPLNLSPIVCLFTWNMNHIQIIFKSLKLIIFKIKPAKQNDVFLPRSPRSTHSHTSKKLLSLFQTSLSFPADSPR
jgi:hypothetical protein